MKKVDNWNDVVNNFAHYQILISRKDSNALSTFSQHYHWYYYPTYDLFAPSKYLGYKRTANEEYRGRGSGGETQKALISFFVELSKTSSTYLQTRAKLDNLAAQLGKKISSNKKGSIYVPKDEYILSQKNRVEQITEVSKQDINGENDFSAEIGGTRKNVLISRYERKPSLRAKAIIFHGLSCKACGFNFGEVYGSHGEDYIEVHHTKPVSTLDDDESVNPITDLTVLCANCHRMVHRKRGSPLTIEELKLLLN